MEQKRSQLFYFYFFTPFILLLLIFTIIILLFSFWTNRFFPKFDAYSDTQLLHQRRYFDYSPGTCKLSYLDTETLYMTEVGPRVWLRVPEAWHSGSGDFYEYRSDGYHEIMVGNRFRTGTGVFIRETSPQSNILVRNSLSFFIPEAICELTR